MSCSDLMKGLVTDLEDAVYMCGLESGKHRGNVSIEVLSKPVLARSTLLRAIAGIEERADLWASRTSHHSLTGQ